MLFTHIDVFSTRSFGLFRSPVDLKLAPVKFDGWDDLKRQQVLQKHMLELCVIRLLLKVILVDFLGEGKQTPSRLLADFFRRHFVFDIAHIVEDFCIVGVECLYPGEVPSHEE